MSESEKLDWIIKHLRYTQALCEVIIENLPEKEKTEMIRKVQKRVTEIF